jgi:hypothetical protein
MCDFTIVSFFKYWRRLTQFVSYDSTDVNLMKLAGKG